MSCLSIEGLLDIQALGFTACASGEALLSNPYFKPAALPEQTNEDVLVWELKAKAWTYGWKSRSNLLIKNNVNRNKEPSDQFVK